MSPSSSLNFAAYEYNPLFAITIGLLFESIDNALSTASKDWD